MTTYSRRQVVLRCVVTALLTAGLLVSLQAARPRTRQALEIDTSVALPASRFPVPMDMRDPRARKVVRERYERLVGYGERLLTPAGRQAVLHLFNLLQIPSNMWWLGIPVIKSPQDMWMMQQILSEVRPDYVIDAGTYFGGSALYFADVLDGLALPEARVITIDIEDMTKEVSKLPLWQKRVDFIHGSSTDPAVVARITERVRGRTVLVALDSDHSRDHVLSELRAYAPLVSPGSYIVVEDTSLEGIPALKGGPLAAVKTFLASEAGASFSSDPTRQAFLYTLHPGGWLRKAE